MGIDKNKKVISLYDKIAKKYSEVFDNDTSDDRYVDEFLSYLKEKDKILDLGCGTGRITYHMYAKGFVAVGVDMSENMLKIARKNYPKLKFVKKDMRKMKFRKESFDAISLAYSLFHLDKTDALKLLKKVKYVLKNKGILFLVLQEGEGEIFVDEPFVPKEKLFLNLYSKKEIEKALIGIGFKILKIKRKPSSGKKGELRFNKLVIICRKN